MCCSSLFGDYWERFQGLDLEFRAQSLRPGVSGFSWHRGVDLGTGPLGRKNAKYGHLASGWWSRCNKGCLVV